MTGHSSPQHVPIMTTVSLSLSRAQTPETWPAGPGPGVGEGAGCEVSNVESRPRGCLRVDRQAGTGKAAASDSGTLAAPGPSLESRFANVLFSAVLM